MLDEGRAMTSGRFPWPGGATAAVVPTLDAAAESGVLWEFPAPRGGWGS
jgi:hypothetical protein